MLIDFKVSSNTQVAAVMPLDQAVYNVLIHLVNVPAMLVTKVPSVMLLVVAIPLDQVVQHVMHQQVNVLVILAIQVPHAILALQIIIEQVVELVQVGLIVLIKLIVFEFNICIFSLWL